MFTALGLIIGYLVPSENVDAAPGLVVVFFSFVGGLFYPLSMMPPVVQDDRAWTPVYGLGEIARAPLTGAGFDRSPCLTSSRGW